MLGIFVTILICVSFELISYLLLCRAYQLVLSSTWLLNTGYKMQLLMASVEAFYLKERYPSSVKFWNFEKMFASDLQAVEFFYKNLRRSKLGILHKTVIATAELMFSLAI